MLDSFRTLLDGLKTATYEVLAVLLPGVVLAHLGLAFFAVPIPDNGVGMLVASYIIGLAVQGLASWMVSIQWLKKRLSAEASPDATPRSPTPSLTPEAYAAAIVRRKLDDAVPDGAIFDICLTRIGAGRQVYDKFIALRDAARGLAAASVVAAILVAIHKGGAFLDSARPTAAVVALLVGMVLFLERYRRFAALGAQVVYGQFIAAQLDAPAPPRSTSAKE